MFYLISPFEPLHWLNMPSVVTRLAMERGIDLAQIDGWEPTEEPHDLPTVLNIALRCGTASAVGILVEAYHVGTVERPDMLRRTFLAGNKAQQFPGKEHSDKLIESAWPGWIRNGEELQQRLDESHAASIAKAEHDAAKVMAREVDPSLVAHWKSLGGVLP